MCVVSMVMDHYLDKWRRTQPFPSLPPQVVPQPHTIITHPSEVTRAEFDALKRDVEEMKALLKRAKKYDEDTGQPDCEMDEKMALVRRIAEAVGVDLDDVLGPPQ